MNFTRETFCIMDIRKKFFLLTNVNKKNHAPRIDYEILNKHEDSVAD